MDYKKRAKPDESVVVGQIDDETPAKKARVADAPAPPPVQQGEAKSGHVFYPSRYKDFDPSKIAFGKEPIKSREGGGELLFMSYLFDDGLKPLMVQTPNAMYSPTGINIWADGKASILLSGGRDWEQNSLMVEFYALMGSIMKRCVEVVAEKGWNTNGSQDPAIIHESFTDLMFIGTKEETGEKYPPSLKAAVVVDGKDPAELFEKVSDNPPTFNCLIPSDVNKGCGVTAILHIPWVFRKKAKKGWAFSVRSTLFQARIFPAVGGSIAPAHGGCAVTDG